MDSTSSPQVFSTPPVAVLHADYQGQNKTQAVFTAARFRRMAEYILRPTIVPQLCDFYEPEE